MTTETYRRVILEPGIHPLPIIPEPFKKILDNYRAGDLTAHIWNREVAQRMAEYQPVVVGIDGLTPDFGTKWLGTPGINSGIWLSLPGRPNKINSQGKIFVVAGDLIRTPLNLENLPPQHYPAVEARAAKFGFGLEISSRLAFASDAIAAFGLLRFTDTVSKIVARVRQKAFQPAGVPSEADPPPNPARREFLRLMTIAPLALVGLRSGLVNLAARAETPRQRDRLQTVLDLLANPIDYPEELHARTAAVSVKITPAASGRRGFWHRPQLGRRPAGIFRLSGTSGLRRY